ncbi:MAG: LuxR C-terminal-related transcriptional regulator [Polyangiaceae bacterium]
MRNEFALDIVETAYTLGTDDRTWLQGLAARFGKLNPHPAGAMAVIYEYLPPPFRATTIEHAHTEAVSTERMLEAFFDLESFAAQHPSHSSRLHANTVCETASEFIEQEAGRGALEALYSRKLHALGVYDAFNVQGTTLSGRALCLIAPTRTPAAVPAATRAVWQRVAVHLGAALRLRTALADLPQDKVLGEATAVFDARTGRCAHATGAAREGPLLAKLRDAVRQVDRARSKSVRHDAPAALELWQGLIAGHYSLVDLFDSDGRRHVVVRANEPKVREDRRLTRREAQATLLAAAANDDTRGAYALGITRETYRTHLRRALRKLGVRDRRALIEIALRLQSPSEVDGGAPAP